jgi:hypothetical protein
MMGRQRQVSSSLLNTTKPRRRSALECWKSPSNSKPKTVLSRESSRGSTDKSSLLDTSSDGSAVSRPSQDNLEEDIEYEGSALAPLLSTFNDVPSKGCPCMPRFRRGKKVHKISAIEVLGPQDSPKTGSNSKWGRYSSLDRQGSKHLQQELKALLIARDKHFQSENDEPVDRPCLTKDESTVDSDRMSREPSYHREAYGETVFFCHGWERKDSRDDQSSGEASSARQLSTLYEEDNETDMSEPTAPKDERKFTFEHKPEKLLEYLRRDADVLSDYSGVSTVSSLAISGPDDFEEVWAQTGEDEIRAHQDTPRPSQKVDNVLASLWSQANSAPKGAVAQAEEETRIPEDIVIRDEQQDLLLQLESLDTSYSAVGDFEEVWAEGVGEDEPSVHDDAPKPSEKVDNVLSSLWSSEKKNSKRDVLQPQEVAKIREDAVLLDEPQDALPLESLDSDNSAIGIFDDEDSDDGDVERQNQASKAADVPIEPITQPMVHLERATPGPYDTAERSFYPVFKTDSDLEKDSENLQQRALLHGHGKPTTNKPTVSVPPRLHRIASFTKRSFRSLGSIPKHQRLVNEESPTFSKADIKARSKCYKELSDDKDEAWYDTADHSSPSVEGLSVKVWNSDDWRLPVDVESVGVEVLTLDRVDSAGSRVALLSAF